MEIQRACNANLLMPGSVHGRLTRKGKFIQLYAGTLVQQTCKFTDSRATREDGEEARRSCVSNNTTIDNSSTKIVIPVEMYIVRSKSMLEFHIVPR